MNRFHQEKREVLATAQEIHAQKLVIGTWGNVSRRISGRQLMAITPSGIDCSALIAEDIVVIDWELNPETANSYQPSTESPLHIAIYQTRDDVGAIVHVHSVFAAAYAVSGRNIPVLLEETAQIIGHEIQVAAYAHCGSKLLADTVVATLGDKGRAVLLANHGLIGVGPDLESALKVCVVAERTAQISVYATIIGQVTPLPEADVEYLHQAFKTYGQAKKV